jgi:Domain of unknown function (DUF1707)
MAHVSEAFWGEFELDPRHPSFASLRASDRDRDLVSRLLGESYAQGRLDREELDARTTALASARALGDLPPLVTDLVPIGPGPGDAARLVGPADLRERAVTSWTRARRDAVWSFLYVSVICWVIWVALGFGGGRWEAGFPWPLFASAFTALNVARIQYRREDLIADEIRSLERKRERERRRELGTQPDDPDESASG